MTLFEHMVLQVRAGLSEIHRNRDRALTFMARYGGSPEMDAWLAELDEQRALHALAIEGMATLRRQDPNHPLLRLQVVPTRMVKMSLRPAATMAKTGTDR